MITVRGVELRVAARVLLTDATFTVSPGDRIALIGRNGAGKTTLLRCLAGLDRPAAGVVTATGPVDLLVQDPRAVDPRVNVADRILPARGLDSSVRALRAAEAAMAAAADAGELERAMRAYDRAEAAFQSGGGYAAEAEAARIATGVGLPDRVLGQPVAALSGGQRRRAELARILFGGNGSTLLLDEPTNHLDADAIGWLRTFLQGYPGGLVVISHDIAFLAGFVNRVFRLDPHRAALDVYNTDWDGHLAQRDADERRRIRQRANAERKAAALHAQAEKMKARVSTAVAARNMARRADPLLAEVEPRRRAEKVARIRLPDPQPCGRIPLGAISLTKSYGAHRVLDGVDLAVDRGSRLVILGHNGAGKTTLLRLLAGRETPDGGRVVPGTGLRLGYFAQEHDTLDPAATVRANLVAAAAHLSDAEVRQVLGAFLFTADDADKPAGVLSGGEKTRLALAGLVHSGANVLLLDEPTNNLDPASRAEVLAAIDAYSGAIVMVTHDEGAIDALRPGRVLILPDADEDLWSEEYRELVTLT
ncbi:ATP-binding cassette domain-containing protein [Nocardia sp. CDC159]|uniref:ATP-binding cassette domain-containing protein n=1 Tax=Nocardia pulmonis TaxID=2951408 RepID=A0A9X2J245_9NOCA|nr:MULTISPECIES: ABC-F family ATP-binding cassette domain-containing protein [Nocardia]MCM6777641.1 ATP-binding cassette domain-containing protein [Nocardia pulmonis]MCM6790555.1 ATP-binding cassette domain-containing protein [Nocardia sp. CDC159]